MKNTPTLRALLKLINDAAIQQEDASKEKIEMRRVLLAVLRGYRDELTATNSDIDAELLKKDIVKHFTQQDVDFFGRVTSDAMNGFTDLLNDVPDSKELKNIFNTMMSVLMQVKDRNLLKKSNVLDRFTNAPSYTLTKLEEIQWFIDIHLRLAKDYTNQMKAHMSALQQFKLLTLRNQTQAKEEIIPEQDQSIIARDYAALKMAFSKLDCLITAKGKDPECTAIINEVYGLTVEIEKKLNEIINRFPAYAKNYMHKLKGDLTEEIKKELPKLIMMKGGSSPTLKVDEIEDEFTQLNNKVCALIGLEAAYSASEDLDGIRRKESDLAAIYLFDANNLNKPDQTIEQKINRIRNLEINIQRRIEYIKKPPVGRLQLRDYVLSEVDKKLIADYENLLADVVLAKGKIASQDRVNKAECKETNKEEKKEEGKEEIAQSAASSSSSASIRIATMFAKQQPSLPLGDILQARNTLGRGGKK